MANRGNSVKRTKTAADLSNTSEDFHLFLEVLHTPAMEDDPSIKEVFDDPNPSNSKIPDAIKIIHKQELVQVKMNLQTLCNAIEDLRKPRRSRKSD